MPLGAAGEDSWFGPNGEELIREFRRCCHCQSKMWIKPRSAPSDQDPVPSIRDVTLGTRAAPAKANDEIHGYCRRCHGYMCGPCYDENAKRGGVCTPWQQWIEAQEAEWARRRANLVAMS
jgi:hypothetical protein